MSDVEQVFLMTDIEGSTALWDARPGEMNDALRRHDEIVARAVESHGGRLIKSRGEGDSTFSVFSVEASALACSLQIQQAMQREAWPGDIAIRVRMGLHSGPVIERDDDYFGETVNRCARLRAAGHGGQVLLSEVVATRAQHDLPDAVSLLDLGIHRLRDLTRPERVFQLCHPDLTQDFPALHTAERRTHNLPSETTTFVGRGSDLAAIDGLVTKHRLVTLSGPGGSGKTRLATHFGRTAVDRFADGVWLVDLAATSRADGVAAAVASALGLREDAGRSVREMLIEHLRQRSALLILDNCEHLVRACGDLVAAILGAAEDVHVLATSREVLGVAGEAIYNVGPLPIPDDGGNAAESDAVRLFIDRLSSARGGATPDDSVLPAIAMICRRLDGIPLAIELAAARARTIGVVALRDRLNDRFGVLTGGSTVSLPRHKTLRGVVDWSYSLLTASERHLLALLAVFVDGWTVDAVETVCEAPELVDPGALELLAQLADKSMIIAEDRDGTVRYRMLETIREYAQEKLMQLGEGPSVRARHLRWAVDLARRAASDFGSPREPDRLHELETEHANLAAALDWAHESAAVETGLQLAVDLSRFWELRGYWSEGISTLQRALAAAPPSALAARASICLARLHQNTGLYDRAQPPAKQALEMARAFGDLEAEASALYELGSLALAADEEAADDLMRRALEIRRTLGDERAIADSLTNLSYRRKRVGDFDGARRVLDEALALFRKAGNAQGISWALTSYSDLSERTGDLARAEEQNNEALALRQSIGDDRGVADSLTNLGGLWWSRGDVERTKELHAQAYAIYSRLGQRDGIIWSQRNLGVALAELGENDAARALLSEYVSVAPEETLGAAVAHAYLGLIADAEGNLDEAIGHVERARKIASTLGIPATNSAWQRVAQRLDAIAQRSV